MDQREIIEYLQKVAKGQVPMEEALPLLELLGIKVETFHALPRFPGYSVSDQRRVLEDYKSELVPESPPGFVTLKDKDGTHQVIEVEKLYEEAFKVTEEQSNVQG